MWLHRLKVPIYKLWRPSAISVSLSIEEEPASRVDFLLYICFILEDLYNVDNFFMDTKTEELHFFALATFHNEKSRQALLCMNIVGIAFDMSVN